MAVSLTICEVFSVKACDLGNWVRGRARSLKIFPFNRPYQYAGPPREGGSRGKCPGVLRGPSGPPQKIKLV